MGDKLEESEKIEKMDQLEQLEASRKGDQSISNNEQEQKSKNDLDQQLNGKEGSNISREKESINQKNHQKKFRIPILYLINLIKKKRNYNN